MSTPKMLGRLKLPTFNKKQKNSDQIKLVEEFSLVAWLFIIFHRLGDN